ncbi:MFS transporter [Amycolatopsis pithecellobii]|uniref:MFS transporter n=1 Tax=Amycolatopsis pithecellobii TaxID=664692 RepID=A0A6N7ZCQ5_9PSEU|nr:MFS transporter [Amycolatopsis pithecellobii]MTD59397.1 MFS transporter [Amycolatopsis pithecellobii]
MTRSNDREPGKPFGLRFTLPLMLGTTLNPINSSMIAVGLAGIAAEFRLGPGTAATLVSVLYLCSAVMQPTLGKLATVFGPRRVFASGLMVLIAGGVLGGLAVNFGMLLVSRALIGVGTSAAYPAAMALVRRRADRLGLDVPSRVLGDFSIASQVTVVLGLPLGGALAGALGWRGLFWINVPLAVITLITALVVVEKDGPVKRTGLAGTAAAIDLPGIGLFAAAIVSLLIFLDELTHPVWWELGVAVVLFAGLIAWERRSRSPLIDVRMLARNPALQRTYLRQLIVGLGVYTSLYAISQWMEGAAGYTSYEVGLILLPMSVVSMVLARIASNRGWVRRPIVIGSAMVVGTGALLVVIQHGSPVALLVAVSVLFGVTNGLSNFANQATLYAHSPSETLAIAAGLFRTFGYVGAIFSSSLIGITFGAHTNDSGLHHLALVVTAIGIAALAFTALDRTIPAKATADQVTSPSAHPRSSSPRPE